MDPSLFFSLSFSLPPSLSFPFTHTIPSPLLSLPFLSYLGSRLCVALSQRRAYDVIYAIDLASSPPPSFLSHPSIQYVQVGALFISLTASSSHTPSPSCFFFDLIFFQINLVSACAGDRESQDRISKCLTSAVTVFHLAGIVRLDVPYATLYNLHVSLSLFLPSLPPFLSLSLKFPDFNVTFVKGRCHCVSH